MGEMNDTHPDGALPSSLLHAEQLEGEGYQQCRNQLCNHMHSPETLESIHSEDGPSGVHECSHCGLTQTPFKRPGTPGGGTNSGISMEEQASIGEDLVQALGEIPEYGPIAWWHNGSAVSNSALDGATIEWGIEVKTYNWTNVRKRGIINARDKVAKAAAINDPQLFADKLSDPELNKVIDKLDFRGLLGVLVLLDFETGLADIFGHAMPKDPVTGTLAPEDVKHITRQFSIANDVPFTHSLPDPRHPDHVPAYLQKQPGADWGF